MGKSIHHSNPNNQSPVNDSLKWTLSLSKGEHYIKTRLFQPSECLVIASSAYFPTGLNLLS